jgi:phosphoribosylanthranilate isomerase
MTTRIKICGISTLDSLEAVIAARADYAGFVFFSRSPRNVSLPQVAALGAAAAGRIKRVGLFVDADDAVIGEAVAAGGLDILQLHGEESPARLGALRARFGLPLWKALPVASAADVAKADAYRGVADLVLFDAKTPKGTLPGGMGLSFDWDLLGGFKAGGFAGGWGLAGGITPENVAQAIERTGAPLVDCSSGVESSAGVKDPARIAAFCTAVRS